MRGLRGYWKTSAPSLYGSSRCAAPRQLCLFIIVTQNMHHLRRFQAFSMPFHADLFPLWKDPPKVPTQTRKKNPHWQIVSADLGHRARGLHMVKSMVRGPDFPLCQLWDHHSCCNNMRFLQARLCITVRILYALTFSFTSLCTVLDYLAKVLWYLHVFWSFECFVFLALTFKHRISHLSSHIGEYNKEWKL